MVVLQELNVIPYVKILPNIWHRDIYILITFFSSLLSLSSTMPVQLTY